LTGGFADELRQALNGLRTHRRRVPGNDGFTCLFNTRQWPVQCLDQRVELTRDWPT
jgi:hypothetical protein